jgi:hypothetical protein
MQAKKEAVMKSYKQFVDAKVKKTNIKCRWIHGDSKPLNYSS